MIINISGEEISKEEIDKYVEHIRSSNPKKVLKTLNIKVDGEYVDLTYTFYTPNFDRIRRITGYLVGTVDRFNNAKRAEVNDRVIHSQMS